jgi:hypothetical protein
MSSLEVSGSVLVHEDRNALLMEQNKGKSTLRKYKMNRDLLLLLMNNATNLAESLSLLTEWFAMNIKYSQPVLYFVFFLYYFERCENYNIKTEKAVSVRMAKKISYAIIDLMPYVFLVLLTQLGSAIADDSYTAFTKWFASSLVMLTIYAVSFSASIAILIFGYNYLKSATFRTNSNSFLFTEIKEKMCFQFSLVLPCDTPFSRSNLRDFLLDCSMKSVDGFYCINELIIMFRHNHDLLLIELKKQLYRNITPTVFYCDPKTLEFQKLKYTFLYHKNVRKVNGYKIDLSNEKSSGIMRYNYLFNCALNLVTLVTAGVKAWYANEDLTACKNKCVDGDNCATSSHCCCYKENSTFFIIVAVISLNVFLITYLVMRLYFISRRIHVIIENDNYEYSEDYVSYDNLSQRQFYRVLRNITAAELPTVSNFEFDDKLFRFLNQETFYLSDQKGIRFSLFMRLCKSFSMLIGKNILVFEKGRLHNQENVLFESSLTVPYEHGGLRYHEACNITEFSNAKTTSFPGGLIL